MSDMQLHDAVAVLTIGHADHATTQRATKVLVEHARATLAAREGEPDAVLSARAHVATYRKQDDGTCIFTSNGEEHARVSHLVDYIDTLTAQLAEARRERDALTPNEHSVMVRVSRELLPLIGEWTADPVHVMVEGVDGGVASLVFKRSEALDTARAELAAMKERVLSCAVESYAGPCGGNACDAPDGDVMYAADVRAAVEGTP